MEDKIIKTLKALRAIEPSEDFVKRSRGLILASPRENHHLAGFKFRIWESFRFAGALAMASFLIFAIFGGLAYFNIKNLGPMILTSFNEGNLLTEANSLDFQIRLNEVNYYEESAKQVTALLDEVSKTADEKNL